MKTVVLNEVLTRTGNDIAEKAHTGSAKGIAPERRLPSEAQASRPQKR